MKEDPNLVANGRFQCLVANGRFQCLMAFERFQCLVVLERFQCLVVLERFQCLVVFERKRRNILFTSSHFSPQQFYLNLLFSIDFKVLIYHAYRLLLTPFFIFPWPINYNHTSRCNKSSTHSLPIWFWLKIFSLSLKLWPHVWSRLMGFKLHKWMKNRLESHP